ncbi:hypothetical protein [uncultured Thiohalocapsa sp.]|uniref:hypothetical protein n=1 Tax=uncultured Thiohalocapsa sp. TaxID=768990 RepID=UPI0025FB9F1B|nr:hypothetical protein [uncultured Thiohalocapsa sp.]
MIMLDGREALMRSVDLIEQAPESANALTLYALASTLEYERAGCLFKLIKLRDMDAEARRLAYGLMELVADETVADDAWQQAKARMDRAIRGV